MKNITNEIQDIQKTIHLQYLKIKRLKQYEKSTHSTGRLELAMDTSKKLAEHMSYVEPYDFYQEDK